MSLARGNIAQGILGHVVNYDKTEIFDLTAEDREC